jgi:hypothetical protein
MIGSCPIEELCKAWCPFLNVNPLSKAKCISRKRRRKTAEGDKGGEVEEEEREREKRYREEGEKENGKE